MVGRMRAIEAVSLVFLSCRRRPRSASTTVPDTSTLVPGGGMSTFTAFDAPALDGGQVAFRGFGSGGQQGIYLDGTGALARVADLTTNLPGSASTFASFGSPALDGGQVAFRADGSAGESGIYRDGTGTFSTIAELPVSPGEPVM